MNKDKMYRYVELLNQYSLGNASLTPDDINLINEVNQYAQNDQQLLNIINQIRQAQNPNERLNMLNIYFTQEQNSIQNNNSNQFETPSIQQNIELQNSTIPINNNVNSEFNQQQITYPDGQQSQIETSNINQSSNYTEFMENINPENYDTNTYDPPKQLKKAGFVNPFMLSLVVGFVGGAIITTLMIILK